MLATPPPVRTRPCRIWHMVGGSRLGVSRIPFETLQKRPAMRHFQRDRVTCGECSVTMTPEGGRLRRQMQESASGARIKARSMLFDLYGGFAVEDGRGGVMRLGALVRLA